MIDVLLFHVSIERHDRHQYCGIRAGLLAFSFFSQSEPALRAALAEQELNVQSVEERSLVINQ